VLEHLQIQPFAVDVSGGVELDKGIKDPAKIDAFLSEVYRVNN
jgi:phosphoribosylanthranilate isomerase